MEDRSFSYGYLVSRIKRLWPSIGVTAISILLLPATSSAMGRHHHLHSKEHIKEAIPAPIEATVVSKTIGLGPHPTDPNFAKFENHFRRHSEKLSTITR